VKDSGAHNAPLWLFGGLKTQKGVVLQELNAVTENLGFEADSAQIEVAAMMDELASPNSLFSFQKWIGQAPSGLYLHGSVGTGKSMLTDCFFRAMEKEGVPSRRAHFNGFMSDVHLRLRRKDMRAVSEEIANEARVLCFDEFQVNDVADAVILFELFKALFRKEVIVVANSNRAPTELYANGINRKVLFEPFVDLLTAECNVVDINKLCPRNKDYRSSAFEKAEELRKTYIWPANDEKVKFHLDELFQDLSGSNRTTRIDTPVAFGRSLVVDRSANGVARFDYFKLCEENLGPNDFLAIAENFWCVFIENIPVLEEKMHNDVRRFICLIDCLYDRRVKCVFSADAPLQDVFKNVEEAGKSEIATAREIQVTDKGGSSGRITTMLGKDFEWSATGRKGASLADIYAKDDVSFAVARAKSRMLEMQTNGYWM